MKKQNSQFLGRLLATGSLTLMLLALAGCSATEVALTNAAEQALTALSANKSLAEQFVKDVKQNVDPGDPEYQKIMGSYEVARDEYNDYISRVESAVKTGESDLPSAESLDGVNQKSVEFISAAAKGIDPAFANRGIKLEKAIVFPSLGSSTKSLSRDARTLMADKVVRDLRWKPWSQL